MSISPESLLKEIREAVAKKKTETGERNAVVRVLAKHGAYKTPKIETGRFGNGSTFRVYIWDTKWGDLVLSSGPSVEGEVQYAEKSQVTDAPDGFYHVLEKAKGTSKITSAMKKIAARQDVTGSTTVSKPKRKKAAPKRKKAKAKARVTTKLKIPKISLVNQLVDMGSNRVEAQEMVDEHYDYIMEMYGDASLSKQAEVIMSLAATAEPEEIEEMAMVEEEPETMSAAERIAATIRDVVGAL